jgi:hypothetical protein
MLENFLNWSSKLFRKPWIALGFAIAITIVFAFGIPKLKSDPTIRNMIPETNRDRIVDEYYEKADRFGTSSYIYIGIDTDDAYSEKSLKYVSDLEAAINDLNRTLPVKNTMKLYGLNEAAAGLLIEALKSVGINESNYMDTLVPLVRSAPKLESDLSLSKELAEKVAKAATTADPKQLFTSYREPVKKTQSLISADYIRFQDDELKVEKLVKDGDLSAGNIASLKDRVASWDVYDKALVSSDGKLTTIVITPSSADREVTSALVATVSDILKTKADPEFKTYLDGENVIENQISDQMTEDLHTLIPVVIVVVLGLLFVNFKTIQGVAYPAAIVLVSEIFTLGLMAYMGIPLSIVGVTIPVLLMAIVSAYGIHQMNHYFLDTETNKLKVLDHNMKSVGLAIMLSGITVVVGFGALATESFVPIRNFGIFTALGDLMGVACALYLLPSMILLSPKPKTVFQTEKGSGPIAALLRFFDRINQKASGPILVVVFAASLASVWGIVGLKSELNNVSFFRKSAPIHIADDHLNDKLAGTEVLNVILDADLSDPYYRESKKAEPSGAIVETTTPEVLTKVEQLSSDVKKEFPFVGKVMSFNNPLKKMNQEMNGGSKDFYRIPESKELISQYLLVFNGDVSDVLTANHDKLKISIAMKRVGSADIEKVKRYCLSYFPKDFLEKNHLRVEIAGASNLYNVANSLLVDGMIESIFLCLAVVFILLLFVLRNVMMSVIAMLPILVTLLFNFGLMGLFNIPLNIATALVSSIAIGIGVDFSIHFITWYRNELRAAPDIYLAIKHSIERKGRAILYNMFVIFGGFIVLTLSHFVPLMQFGLLVSGCMVFSGVGALVIVPAVLRLLAKHDYDFLYLGTREKRQKTKG